MNKRKLLLLASALCMVAILAVGGTLAYFTDTDRATNTFTIGHVDITLEEEFTQKSKLFPDKRNAVPKEVSIKLEEGSEDAYVWYVYLIPAVLDSTDGNTGTNNIVHVNAYGYTWDTYRENANYWPEGQTAALPLEKTWDHDANVELSALVGPEGFIGTETIDKIVYNKYLVLYHGILKAGESTTPAMSQVYLDAGVDTKLDENNNRIYVNKNGEKIDYNMVEDIQIIVRAYGIQEAGFKDVYEAYTTYMATGNTIKN